MSDGRTTPLIPEPDTSGADSDTLATQEEKGWSDYAAISKAKRNNTLLVHKTIGVLIPVALVVAFLGFLALGIVYVWHLVVPTGYRWLTSDELQHIHSMIFSSVVGGAIALVAKAYFIEKDEKKN
ncbi:hypothetical protein OF829_19735 [Sphingomonas sp. LB-2]|uniref:hypothetical protein n=1 Tax=Sphingomonas caeni TaxID=2984949 RepID=UPI0022317FE6|nr:hypothetical protein [Sphingomonas caeni]MCW3849475.1 hypothetical protein [Sphingomonas caeni]